MKNILDIMKELGIEVPEDKTAELNKAVTDNYKTVAEFDKKVARLEAERDSYKEKAETAEETLKGFDGVDVNKLNADIAEWKTKAENAEKDYQSKLASRDFDDALKTAIYLMDELYVNKQSNEQTAKWILDKGYNDYTIICDSAEPKSVADYKAFGLPARGAVKGAGSVDYGFKWLQRRKIVIDPKRTPNAYNEIINYEYDRDKEGKGNPRRSRPFGFSKVVVGDIYIFDIALIGEDFHVTRQSLTIERLTDCCVKIYRYFICIRVVHLNDGACLVKVDFGCLSPPSVSSIPQDRISA